MHTIAMNAGAEGAVVVGELLKTEDPEWGHNAATGEYCNMIQAGIIDPTKVCSFTSRLTKGGGGTERRLLCWGLLARKCG